jgi:non-specific serine/threonine protein kinase/serine/threonine-protein kinase
MNSDRWRQVFRLYEAALKRSASERDAYLRDGCAGDEELWREVEALLTRQASGKNFSTPAGAMTLGDLDTLALSDSDSASSIDPRTIGPYRLVQKIGEGGMAEVWLAEQTTPVHRRVAIKLIKAGMDTKAMVTRFEAERQALALMDHPAIAKVFDGGATAAGRPYFAMEYVSGTQITEYCDKYHLAMRERLDLFILVCEGVQHAHQKAVIHRDLKPSNILITLQDDKPVPKIIDFGVAKAIGQPLTGRTLFTQIGVLVGTPEYMSPEQTELTAQNIDTRTDVYSLGLILYELLVGALPFDAHELRRAGFDEILRRIRDEEPPRPSAKVRTLGEASATCARNRNTEPRTLARQLEGDLDLIVIKTLEKDRTRRYGSPSDLAADIARYLHDEPVLASQPSVAYRARKFVRRHRSGVGVAAGVLLLLIGFAVTMTAQAQRVARERDRANQEADVSRQVTDLLTGLFRVVDPSEAHGNQVTAREILDRGARQIDIELRAQPEIQARLMHTMGVVYTNLGLYRQAQELLERAVETERRTLGPEHRDTLSATNSLGLLYVRRDRWSDAEAMFRNTLSISRRVFGPDHRQTASTMTLLAEVLMRQQRAAYRENVGSPMYVPEAEELYRKAMDISLRVVGPEHLETLTNRAGLGTLFAFQNRHVEAERELRETLSIARRVLGQEDAFTLNVTGLLSQALLSAERYPEAESVAREFVAGRVKVLGLEHPLTLVAQTLLARDLLYQKRYKEVEQLSQETLEIQRRVQPESKNTFDTWFNLFASYKGQHRYAEADKQLREMLTITRRVFGENDDYTNHVIENFGVIAALRGRRDEAFLFLKQAVDHGFRTYEGIANDEDLNSLHGDPRFDELLAEVRRRVAGESQSHGTAPRP